ncbi:hypothetical protein COLO4_02421 [Corchorus olitorius]|uniref:Uncharacterized protein n=1 Tax=Corchorus olitorius TaxID=93759 RepID=A0A1R3L139_9ROSI|nr:hypothetical protein COLO4_02421 [Corchorus olitorius]
MHGAAVVGHQQRCTFNQRSQFAERERPREVQHALPRDQPGQAHLLHQFRFSRRTGHQHRTPIAVCQRARDVREAFGRIAPRRRSRPRMQHDPRCVRGDTALGQLGAHGIAIRRAYVEAQPMRQVRGHVGHVLHEVQLASHLVAHVAGCGGGNARIGVGNPVGQQRVRVLAAVREAQRNARQKAQHGGRQRVLRVHGKDDGRVECAVAQGVDQRAGLLGVCRVGVLGPRHIADDHVVDVGQVRGRRGARSRGQQREMTARAARVFVGLQRMKGRRGHHHVAQVVRPHAQDAARVGPHRAALGNASRDHATALRWCADDEGDAGDVGDVCETRETCERCRACCAITMAAASSKRPTM